MTSHSNLELTVLIPAHNEEKRMENCLTQLSNFLKLSHPSSEIVISEDGSKDRTLEIVNKFIERSASETCITLLHADKRLGKEGGLKRGIEVAQGRYTVFTDTDLPVPLETITSALRLLRTGADIVAGSRVMKGSSRDEPFRRRALSKGFHVLARILLGVRWDSQCGFKAVSTSIGRGVFARVANSGFAYDVEFLIHARRLGAKVVELPVQWHYNKDSSVKLSKDAMGIFRDLLHIFLHHIWYASLNSSFACALRDLRALTEHVRPVLEHEIRQMNSPTCS
jgi:dolichyl-phosphate beta-glucosyltransferase